jgi:hypothetical protein
MDKLKTARDFTEANPLVQANFAGRVLAILKYAIEDTNFQAPFLAALQEANTSCVDRSVYYLNTLELTKLLFEAKDKTRAEIFDLLKGAFALQELEKIARDFASAHNSEEAIEVYLHLQNSCKKEFNLPIVTEGMNYPRCSGITENDETTIKTQLTDKISDKPAFAHYLSSIDIWKEKIKQEFAEGLEKIRAPFYEQLEKETEEEDYKNATADVQKTLVLDIQLSMQNSENQWIEAVTLSLL